MFGSSKQFLEVRHRFGANLHQSRGSRAAYAEVLIGKGLGELGKSHACPDGRFAQPHHRQHAVGGVLALQFDLQFLICVHGHHFKKMCFGVRCERTDSWDNGNLFQSLRARARIASSRSVGRIGNPSYPYFSPNQSSVTSQRSVPDPFEGSSGQEMQATPALPMSSWGLLAADKPGGKVRQVWQMADDAQLLPAQLAQEAGQLAGGASGLSASLTSTSIGVVDQLRTSRSAVCFGPHQRTADDAVQRDPFLQQALCQGPHLFSPCSLRGRSASSVMPRSPGRGRRRVESGTVPRCGLQGIENSSKLHTDS